MSKMQSSKLKWIDLLTNDRHMILGQVIDGMIYHYECVNEVREMLQRWDENGFLKSIILPNSEPDEDLSRSSFYSNQSYHLARQLFQMMP